MPSELSARTLGIGAVLGVVFAGTTMYAGTKIAFIDGGNIAAVLIALPLLAALKRAQPHAHEGNIVQTVSSSAAMMAITGGFLGPVAALVLAGREVWLPGVVVWGIALGILGCFAAIPLRGAFIERGTLPFPSGTATAEVLSTVYVRGASARSHLRLLALGAALAAAVTFMRTYLGWIPEWWTVPFDIGLIPAANIGMGVGWSPLLAGIGALSGVRVGVSLVVGAALAWATLAPLLVSAGIAEPDYLSLLNWLLWPGTGLMLGGTVGSVLGAWRGMRRGLREMREAPASELRLTRGYAIALALAALAVIVTGSLLFDVHPAISALALVMSAVLCAAAARAMGETDNTPAGPLGGFAQITTGLIAPGGVTAPLVSGGVVNGTLMHSAMLLQNWKAGRIVGAAPRPQLVAQLVGVVVGGIACAGAFELIRAAYGLGSEAMPAPAAQSWKATAELVQHGISSLPAYAPLAALLAFVIGIALSLWATKSARVPSPIAMGMAFILPPYLSITIAIGGVAWWLVARRHRAWTETNGVSLASGLIAGEAIAGLIIAGLVVGGIVP